MQKPRCYVRAFLMSESEVNVMPHKPKIPCKYSGCPELVPSGAKYCIEHCKQLNITYTGNRPSSAQRGYGSKWKKARKSYLERNPLCVRCLAVGRYTPATVVDHIIPHRGNAWLFWKQSNWQALCERCHNIKTMTEDIEEYSY